MAPRFESFLEPRQNHFSTREGLRATKPLKTLESESATLQGEIDVLIAQRDELTDDGLRTKLERRINSLSEKLAKAEVPEIIREWVEETFDRIHDYLNVHYYNNLDAMGPRQAYVDFNNRQKRAPVMLRKALLALAQTVDFRIRYARTPQGALVPRQGFWGHSYSEEKRKQLLERVRSIDLDPATLADAIVGYYTYPHPEILNPFELPKGEKLEPTRLMARILDDARRREAMLAAFVELDERTSLQMPRDVLNEELPEGAPKKAWIINDKKFVLLELMTAAQLALVGKLAENCIITFADQLIPQRKGKNSGRAPTRFFAFCEMYDEPTPFMTALEGRKSSRVQAADKRLTTWYRPHIVMEYQANTRSIGQVKEFQNEGLKRGAPETGAFLEALDALRTMPGMEIQSWGNEFESAVGFDSEHYLTLKGEKRIGDKMEKGEVVLAVSQRKDFSFNVNPDIDMNTAKFWLSRKVEKGHTVNISQLGNRPDIWNLIQEVGTLRYHAIYALKGKGLKLSNTVPEIHLPNLTRARNLIFDVNFNKGEKIAESISLPKFSALVPSHGNELNFEGVNEVYAPLLEISDNASGPAVDLRLKKVRLIECKKIGESCRLVISSPNENHVGLSIICPSPITDNISVGVAYFTDTHEEYDEAQKCFVYPGVKGLRRFVSREAYDAWLSKAPPVNSKTGSADKS